MQSFSFNDAIRFRLATQQDDTGAKIQVFFGLAVALVATFFVFSGYWQKVKDQPASMRFWNAVAYAIPMDVIVSTWLPSAVC